MSQWNEEDAKKKLDTEYHIAADLEAKVTTTAKDLNRYREMLARAEQTQQNRDLVNGIDFESNRDACDDIAMRAFYFSVTQGGLTPQQIAKYGPEVARIVDEAVQRHSCHIPASQYVPRGDHDDVQKRLEQSERALDRVRTELATNSTQGIELQNALDATASRLARLEEEHKRVNERMEVCRLENEKLKIEAALASDTYESTVARLGDKIELQSEVIAKRDELLQTTFCLIDTYANKSLSPDWSELFAAGDFATPVEVTASGWLWLPAWGLEQESVGELNVHQLCCDAIFHLRRPIVPGTNLTAILTATATSLCRAQALSEVICRALVWVIVRRDWEQEDMAFDVCLILAQIIERVGACFPETRMGECNEFCAWLVTKLSDVEAELMQKLINGWDGKLWDDIELCAECSQDDTSVAPVESVGMFLVIRPPNLRWATWSCVVRPVFPDLRLVSGEEAVEFSLKKRCPRLAIIRSDPNPPFKRVRTSVTQSDGK